MLRKLSVVPLLCARSANEIFILLYTFLLRKLSIVPLLCARSAKIFLLSCTPFCLESFQFTPFCLESCLLYPFFARAARRTFLLHCTPFCLQSFLLYLFWRSQREETNILLYCFLLRMLFSYPFFCACSAKKISIIVSLFS